MRFGHNALQLLAKWLRQMGDEIAAQRYDEHAQRARVSFNQRFWFAEGGYLYDVVDCNGQNRYLRQIFPAKLRFLPSRSIIPLLDQERWNAVVDLVQKKLVTPVGLRSLVTGRSRIQTDLPGDLRSRDGAYHQGTVWAWLIGPFIDAG